jgi:hypothetical protein
VTFHFNGKTLEGRTRNVSRGGVCAQITDMLPNGATVEIDVTLIFDEETQSEPLRLPGRITWCTPLDGGFQVGLMFRPLDAEQNEFLGLFLKYLDAGGQRERPFAKTANIDDRFG